jgi:citrate/tricarballylate utilization protein
VLSVFTVASIVLVIGLYQLFGSVGPIWETTSGPNSFYRVVSHTAMALPAALLSVVVLGAIAWGLVVSMREGGMTRAEAFAPRVWSRAVLEAVTLHWLGGGGGDCYFPEAERASPTRRVLHHVVAYGFLLTFLSTVSAAFMGYALGERPPYAVLSVPVILGAVGGVGVLVGATAFLILNGRNPTGLTAPTSAALDSAFLVALILVCATGIALLVVQKGVGVVHVVLLVHLATILMFYITIPYGKLMHGVYRFGALLRNARDTRAAG